MRRALRMAAAGLVSLALLLGGILLFLIRRNLPDSAVPRIPGLKAPVSVSFDDRGVALVSAATLLDAIRVQGYLTARERLFQLEIQRRAAAGELAELFGRPMLELDRRHRTCGFSRVAAAGVPLLPPGERDEVEALTGGINAFLDSHDGRSGLEFALLRQRPRRFTPADSLLVLLLMCEDLSTTWPHELAVSRLGRLAPAVRSFLLSSATGDDVTLVRDISSVLPPPLPVGAVGSRSAWAGPPPPVREREDPGSNAWVVSGALTKSGKPILANDPHLSLLFPALWLPMRFSVAGRRIEGVTLPGLPGIVLGRNDRVAWGFANLYADVQDLYRETLAAGGRRVRRGAADGEVRERLETIAIRGEAPDRWPVRETSHGPLVRGPFALKWTALDPGNLRLPGSRAMLAGSAAELLLAFDDFLLPAQSIVVADVSGTIGWRAAGRLPIRREGTDGSVPYDGADPANDWRGFVPASAMPRVLDPPSGLLVTANQRVVGTSFPHTVATDWPSPVRARRIRDLLEEAIRAGRKLDRAAMETIQLDAVSEPLRGLASAFLPALPPHLAAGFRGWDGRADSGSRPFLVARALRRQLEQSVRRAWRITADPFPIPEYRLVDIARATADAWWKAGLGEKDVVLAECAEGAVRDLTSRYGSESSRWKWGEANRLQARHPLGRVFGLSWLFDPPGAPQSGATGTPRAAAPAFGQSMRFVVDWGEPESATLVVPFGVSGHVGSPNRLDQLPYWLGGDPAGAATRLARPATGARWVFQP